MAKALPLGINWINTSAGKESFVNEALPVDLILVLFRRESACNLEYFDKLSYCESCPLTILLFTKAFELWGTAVVYLVLLTHVISLLQDVGFLIKELSILQRVIEPLDIVNHSDVVMLILNRPPSDLEGEALNYLSDQTSISLYHLSIIFSHVRHVEYYSHYTVDILPIGIHP